MTAGDPTALRIKIAALLLSGSMHVGLSMVKGSWEPAPAEELPQSNVVELWWQTIEPLADAAELLEPPEEEEDDDELEVDVDPETHHSVIRRPQEVSPELPPDNAEPAAAVVAIAGVVGSESGLGSAGLGGGGPAAEGGGEGTGPGPGLPAGLDLSPRAIAESAVGFGPRLRTAEQEEAALARRVSGDLYQAANATPHETVRPPPELRERGDGGFDFEGGAFTAEIAPDGEVTFTARGNLQYRGSTGIAIGGSFDLSDAVESAMGNDPHSSERRWFMRETRRLRERLAEAAQQRRQGRALVGLRRQIQTLWNSDRSPEERRRRLFRLWDGFAEDEVGAEARGIVVSFIQGNLGRGSADAYPESELASLNRRRHSSASFAPY